MRMLREELIELQDTLQKLPPLTGAEPLDAKRARWATEDRAAAIGKELRRAFDWAESKFTRAVELVPTLEAPRTMLADMHWRRYRDAIEAFDHAAAEDHLKAVTRYRPQDLRLQRPTLTLHTQPAGARVTLHRVVERDRLLIETAPRVLGQTPLEDVVLPTGRSVLTIELPDRRPVRLPIFPWQGDRLAFEVQVPTNAALGDAFAFVPGGTYVRGGDPEALLAKQAQFIDVGPYAIQRLPVTCRAYFDFLNAIAPEEAHARVPRLNGNPYMVPGADGRYPTPLIDVDGDEWAPDWPIFAVSFDDARAYCAWASARDDATYRLPSEDEWEKAARGPDGRLFPWGDHFDPTFTRMRYSLPGDLMPKPVGLFKADCSPYGVRDLAGNVREWTDGWIEEGLRTVRGGAFNHYAFTCRAASRFGYNPKRTLSGVGFRMVKVI
jgi:serine/threonine-protein kinase